VILLLLNAGEAWAGGFKYELPFQGKDPMTWQSVVGFVQGHTVGPEDTLLDIARRYGLGYNELELLYPQIDPWLPKAGSRLLIPSQWVLPPTTKEGIVINIPEMRLYRFFPKTKMVKTYPVGIGDQGWESPEGVYRVVDRQIDPGWQIPHSLREKYGVSFMPPGPDNPLGKHWLGLSRKGYGIHGTNFPWAVGRLVTHGCIRLYPENMERLFEEVPVNTSVELIYELVKVGVSRGEIYMEVHPDIYGKVRDMEDLARKKVKQLGLWNFVSWQEAKIALQQANGVPVRIGVVERGKGKVAADQAFSTKHSNEGTASAKRKP
jgi:L,D-transpeptidase ErfK/SrfK